MFISLHRYLEVDTLMAAAVVVILDVAQMPCLRRGTLSYHFLRSYGHYVY